MLALCCSSRQVVVADEDFKGPDMIGELLGERQRLAHQTGDPLTQRVVEPLDMIGFRANLLMARCCTAGITFSYPTY